MRGRSQHSLKFTAELHIINHQRWVLLKQCKRPVAKAAASPAMQRSWKLLASSIHASDHSVLESWKGWNFFSLFLLRLASQDISLHCNNAARNNHNHPCIHGYAVALLPALCKPISLSFASQHPLVCPSCSALNLASFSCRGRWFWAQIPHKHLPCRDSTIHFRFQENTVQATQASPFAAPQAGLVGL